MRSITHWKEDDEIRTIYDEGGVAQRVYIFFFSARRGAESLCYARKRKEKGENDEFNFFSMHGHILCSPPFCNKEGLLQKRELNYFDLNATKNDICR